MSYTTVLRLGDLLHDVVGYKLACLGAAVGNEFVAEFPYVHDFVRCFISSLLARRFHYRLDSASRM